MLTFAQHSDQQLRGLTMTLIGFLIKSALSEGRACFADWMNSNSSSADAFAESSRTASSTASINSMIYNGNDRLVQLSTLVSSLVQVIY